MVRSIEKTTEVEKLKQPKTPRRAFDAPACEAVASLLASSCSSLHGTVLGRLQCLQLQPVMGRVPTSFQAQGFVKLVWKTVLVIQFRLEGCRNKGGKLQFGSKSSSESSQIPMERDGTCIVR